MTKQLKPEKLVVLEWIGPFSYGKNGLDSSLLDRFGPGETELNKFYESPGIYIIIGDHPIHGARSLLYIGATDYLDRRLAEHHCWIRYEWRVEVYFTKIENTKVREEVEKLLIYSHSPCINAQNISNPPDFDRHIRIWNEGRYWKLFPEVSTQHPWYLS